MWSKTSLEEGPISQKLRENAHSIFHRPWYLGPSTLPILYYFVFDVYFVTLKMWLLIYAAHQNTKIAKNQASRFHFQGEYPPCINSYTWVTMWSKTSLEEGPISQKLRENIFHRPWYLASLCTSNTHWATRKGFRQKKNETMSANKLALALMLRFWGC